MQLDLVSLDTLIAESRLSPAKKLTVGQLRIATVPSIVRPERHGAFDPAWLESHRVAAVELFAGRHP